MLTHSKSSNMLIPTKGCHNDDKLDNLPIDGILAMSSFFFFLSTMKGASGTCKKLLGFKDILLTLAL